jgi:hypothetical protein
VDSEGNYTDRHGKLIRIGTPVQVAEDYDYPGPDKGVGEVVTLPPDGNDWHGFPHVRMHEDGKLYHIPDSALTRLGAEPGSPVALLEDAVNTTQASNAAKLRLIQGSGGEQ